MYDHMTLVLSILSSQTAVDGIDRESLKRQTYLWRNHFQAANRQRGQPPSLKTDAGYLHAAPKPTLDYGPKGPPSTGNCCSASKAEVPCKTLSCNLVVCNWVSGELHHVATDAINWKVAWHFKLTLFFETRFKLQLIRAEYYVMCLCSLEPIVLMVLVGFQKYRPQQTDFCGHGTWTRKWVLRNVKQ